MLKIDQKYQDKLCSTY